MSNELPEFIKPFHFHGVDVSHSSGSEWTAECPICDKGEHWYVNDTNGMWECKSCGESGNVSTFLKHHHAQCLSDTTPAQYKELATLRHPIPTSIFKINRLAYDSDNRRWLVPIYNDTGGLSNLRVWFKVKDPKTGDYKYLFLNTPGCKAQLFGADQLGPKSKERYPDVPKGGHPHVILCEGEWDGMAMQNIVNKAKIEATVVAVPGANIYKDYWSKLFKGKTLWICYDNDEDRETSSGKIVNPGKDGMVRVLGRLKASKSKPKEVLDISWPSSTPLS